MFRVVSPPIIRSTHIYLQHLVQVKPLLLPAAIVPDAIDTVERAPDDGWRYHPKHVEQFPDINKLCNVASCWIYIRIKYRVIHKSLRDFRTRLRNNQDRHGRKEKGRESLQVFFLLGALAYFQVPPLGGSRDEKWRSQ